MLVSRYQSTVSCQVLLTGNLKWACFEPTVMGRGGHEGPHHNFVVIALMIMKFGTDIKLDVVYTVATNKFVTSLLLRNYDS